MGYHYLQSTDNWGPLQTEIFTDIKWVNDTDETRKYLDFPVLFISQYYA